MMPTPTSILAGVASPRPTVPYRYDGAAMRDQASLIEAHIPGLRRFACALLRGDRQSADDLVQDCLERAVSRWHLRRAEGDLRGWLYTILYNRFLSDKHRQGRRGVHDALLEVAEAELPGVDGGQDWALEHRDLLRQRVVYAAPPLAMLIAGID